MGSAEKKIINFEAELMQGYNNPQIEIVNVEISDTGVITNITFEHLVKILSRGVLPIMVLWQKTRDDKKRIIAPLSYIEAGTISFRSAEKGLCGLEFSINGAVTPLSNE